MKRKILVIEDEDSIRELVEVSLQIVGGWEVVTASSGAEGVALAASEAPDAILLDVMMPDMDGPATLMELRAGEATREIPVIFVTARLGDADLARLETLGAAAVLPKPFDPMQLSGRIAAVLGWEDG